MRSGFKQTKVEQLDSLLQKVPFVKMEGREDYFRQVKFDINENREITELSAKMMGKYLSTLQHKNLVIVVTGTSTLSLASILSEQFKLNIMRLEKPALDDQTPAGKDVTSLTYDAASKTRKRELRVTAEQATQLKGANVVILDSVLIGGSTMCGIYDVLTKAGVPSQNIHEAFVVFTEEHKRTSIKMNDGRDLPLRSITHLDLKQPTPTLKIK